MMTSSVAAYVMFECMELDLIPKGTHPLDAETISMLRFVFTLSAFLGIIIPAVLLLCQSNRQYQAALKRNRLLAMDEKLAAIGRLAAGAAHEINNPLAIIRLTFENLEQVMPEKDQRVIKFRIQRAYDAIARIQGILQKLLVSRHRVPEFPEPLCVHTMAQLIAQRIKSYLHHHGIQLNVKIDPIPRAVIQCQLQYVLDAVDSLINNALEAMRGHHAPEVSLTLRSQDLFFQVQVEDRGPGVSDEIRGSIFTPFFTTKEVGTGLGLSLYSARCIARQYGGDLTCESGPGGRFCLSLPMQKLL